MVVIGLPATAEMGVTHDCTGWPSMWTVQAPHSDMPHPNLVPVMPSVSRKTQSSGMAETASTDCGLPFKVNLTAGILTLLWAHSLERVYANWPANRQCAPIDLARFPECSRCNLGPEVAGPQAGLIWREK